ncbi:MAG: hypothetical protein EZS28_044711, partial [Streblomastix strix]
MEKDEDDSKVEFDPEIFESALHDVMDPVELWLLSGDLQDSDDSSPTTVIRMVKDIFNQGLIDKPPGIVLAEAVQCSPPLVSKVWNNSGYKKVENKNSALLTKAQEEQLLQKVLYIIDNTGFITAQEIRYWAEKISGKPVGHNWHVDFILRHNDEIGAIETDKREESRVKVSEESVLIYKILLITELKGIPVELIACTDEVGYQQYCDSRRRMIIVRKANTTKPLHNPTDRAERRISIMSGAGMSGDCMLPFVILKKPVDLNQHLLAGTRHGIDAYIAEAEGTTMTGPLFCEFLLNCAVPFFDKQRKLIGADIRTPAAILLDNCPSHISEFSRQICALNNIKLLTLPPNSTQYLQMLDLGIFGAFKSHLQTLRRHNTHDTQEHITHLALSALHQALAQINVINSFKECGLLRRIADDGRVYAEIDNATFDSIIDSIEAEHTLLKYKGTRQTRVLKKRA